jgi:hypothetical protein
MVKLISLRVSFLGLCLLALLSNRSIAQIEHIGRFELPFSWEIEDFHVIPNDDKGCLIITVERQADSDQMTAKFMHLDNDFSINWSDDIKISDRYFVEASAYFGDANFVLLKDRADLGDIKLIVADLANESVQAFDERRLNNIEVTDFLAIQNSVIIAGELNGRPSVFLFDLASNRLQALTNIYQNKGELLEVKVNKDKQSFNVLLSAQDDKKDRTILVNTYDYKGTFIRKYQLQTEPFYQLTNGVSSSINDIEQVVVGLYNYKKGTDPSGYFVNHVDKAGKQSMKYLPFGAFVSFFAHEGEGRAQRLRERSLRELEDEKPYRYNVDAILNPMLERDDKLIINTQFFKPINYIPVNSVKAKDGDAPRSTWNPASLDRTVLEGSVDFTHSFTFEIDLKGNLIWDLNTEINTSQRGGLKAFGEFSDDLDNLLFSHYYEEELFIHELRTSRTYYGLKLKLLRDNEELKYENPNFGGLLAWNNNRYLIYGIHHIARKTDSEASRKVYFVNGIRFKPIKRTNSFE